MFGSAITSNDSKEESKETQQLAEAKHQQFMEETKNGSATTNDGKNVDVDVRVNLGSFIDGCEIKYVLQQIVSQLDSSKCGTNDVLYGLKRDFPATMPMVNRLFKFQSPFLSFLRPSSPPLPTARPTPSSHLTHVHICFPINLKELRKEHPNMAYILSQVGKVDLCVTNRDESKLLARVAVTRR